MSKTSVTAILLLFAMSLGTCVCAGTTTEGLTSVSVAVTGNTTVGFDYSFTVFNNSADVYTNWNVLVAELNIYNVVAGTKPNLLAPASVISPTGWTYDLNGNGWKSNSVISYDPISNNMKYWSPPSIAPGGSLTGFVLHYDSIFDSSAFEYQTHVLAVLPLTGPPVVPQYYTPTNVSLNSGIYNSKVTGVEGTWWDKPCVNGSGHPNGALAVPEASTILLGSIGLLGPMGYALRKRKLS